MSKLQWGKVFYQESFAGILQEEPGDCFSFTYDNAYLASNSPAISYTLPKETQKHTSYFGLPVFFDNLVQQVEKQWKTLFVSLGQTLSKKP